MDSLSRTHAEWPRHWFYEDYLRPINPFLPSLSQKHFANLIIASSPIYANLINAGGAKIDYDAVWIDYMEYKRMVPTCGVILVNRQGTKVRPLSIHRYQTAIHPR